MGCVKIKEGVEFSVIAPGGFAILSAITRTAASFPFDLTITSATDGEHSGPQDPHHTGNAYDIRTHDLAPDLKNQVLALLKLLLGDKFFAFIEDQGGPDEHIHVQVNKGEKCP